MARHAQPRERAELTGAVDKNPQRYTGTPAKNANPLPDPPRHLSAASKKIWLELSAAGLPGVLTAADVFHVEQTVELIAEFREVVKHNKSVPKELRRWGKELARLNAEQEAAETKTEKREIGRTIRKHMKIKPAYMVFPTARITAVISALSKLGMNPTDRQRINLPDSDGAPDPDDFEALH